MVRVKNVTQSFVPIRTQFSLDKQDIRRNVINLYKAWYKQIPMILHDYNLPISNETARSKLREIYVKNSRIKDPRVISGLIVKGQMELNEIVNKQKEDCHIWKYFREEQTRPKTFLNKFLDGN